MQTGSDAFPEVFDFERQGSELERVLYCDFQPGKIYGFAEIICCAELKSCDRYVYASLC
jgi:hypothetical protein